MDNQQNFEERLTALEKIVQELEKGEAPLDEALEQFKDGIQLTKSLQKELENAETTLTKVMQEDNTLADFKLDDD